MLAASIALAALALILAWPVPMALARARWTGQAPATALVVWQAVALAGGLSMIGALLSYGLAPYGDSLVHGLVGFLASLTAGTLPTGAEFSQMFALSGAILLGAHLLLNLGLTFSRAELSRRRHRQLVDLLSSPIPERPGTRLIEHEAPVAYCLPGTTQSITVLSAGLVQLLDSEQLRAVIAHERAHATQRHDILLLAFRAWRGALPWFPIATRAEAAVAVLVEMLADDWARREVPDSTLAESIALVASEAAIHPGSGAGGGASALAADSPSARARIGRLVDVGPALPLPVRMLALASAVALLAVPTFLLLEPTIR